jgi:rhodanese-related sulfurtransferase
MDDYQKLVAKALVSVDEILPWDLEEEIAQNSDLILLDIREQAEFEMMHIKDALHVARGVLEGFASFFYIASSITLIADIKENRLKKLALILAWVAVLGHFLTLSLSAWVVSFLPCSGKLHLVLASGQR